MEDLTGKQLGPYQLTAPLGQGGMAVVYKAYQPSTERYVALKILPRHFAAEPNFVQRFKQEAKIIASLEHPNILPVYDYGESDGYTYIVMRFVEGGKSLADLMLGQPLPLSQVCDLLKKISAALDYAHLRGIVHRDIKPGNVLVDPQGNLLLSDFGLAKIYTSSAKLTTSGAFIGTPTYASPEQCMAKENLDGRSDVYSLGVMLYEMVTGRPPYTADTPMAVVFQHVHDPLPMPSKVNPGLPGRVEQVVLKALAKEREGRYQTAGELVKALEAAVVEKVDLQPTLSEQAEAAQVSPAKKHRISGWVLTGGCLTALILLAGVTAAGIKFIPLLLSRSTGTPVNTAVGGRPTTIKGQTPTSPSPLKTTLPAPSRTVIITPGVPSNTPAIPAIQILQQFKAPGQAESIAWDGTNLWIAEGQPQLETRFLKIDTSGNTKEIYNSNLSMAPMMRGDATGMIWVDGTLWLTRGNLIEGYNFESGNMISTGSFGLPDQLETDLSVFTFFGEHTLAWDGQSYWVSVSTHIYRLSPDGTPVENFEYPRLVSQLLWDGELLWAVAGDRFFNNATLDVVDTRGGCKPIVSFSMSTIQPKSIWPESLTWDGQSFWALASDTIYQLDVSGVRVYAAAQSRLSAETGTLSEVLKPDTEVEVGRVKVVNKTTETLTITFENYNYVVSVPPNSEQLITPPENAFVAEVPGLPAISGSYFSLTTNQDPGRVLIGTNYGFTWVFSIYEPVP